MTTIEKWFTFEAGHRLPHLPKGHPCSRQHGHSYSLVLGIEGELRDGMVIEYGVLSRIVRPIIKAKESGKPRKDCVDHAVLNDIAGLDNPTTEVVAGWFFDKLEKKIARHGCELVYVRVHESRTTNATHRP